MLAQCLHGSQARAEQSFAKSGENNGLAPQETVGPVIEDYLAHLLVVVIG